ncbi:MAG: undecaprenyl/decaprenyl-phosphate alpha-N-acetylglucosaminyl 1-phosphate transferase [Candidatus Schekmanbacteria bacterium]|nr:undecaprenyl/decaprenyl-phosphate alpha-N-acetylglucosaminyl 1-phosphate transferase [Candidatus Schekmanbacteria bacterium]
MSYFILIFACALVLSLALTPLARKVGIKTGIINTPSSERLNMAATPLLGGAAIYLSFLIALIIFRSEFRIDQCFGIFTGATLVSFFGLYDDWRELNPALKFGGQLIPLFVLVSTGVKVEIFESEFINILITGLWVIGITNSINLLDNMDGIAGGVASIASLSFLVLAIMNGQYLVGSLAAAMLGACLGFLRYNLNPARIFMGDTGSMFIGFLLASVGIKLRFPGLAVENTWMIPVVILSFPIFDTTLVTISRAKKGLNPFTTPGKDHSTHRLCLLGLSHKKVAYVVYLISLLFGALGVLIFYFPGITGYMVFAATILIGIIGVVFMERLYEGKRN